MQNLPQTPSQVTPQIFTKTTPHGQSTLVVLIVLTDVMIKTAQPIAQPIRRRDRLMGALCSGTRALIEELPGGEVAIALWDGWRHPGRSR